MFTQSSGVHFTIDLNKTKNIIQVTHSFKNCTPSHHKTIKHLEAVAERFCIEQKQYGMLFRNCKYVSMLHNVLPQTETPNTYTPKLK